MLSGMLAGYLLRNRNLSLVPRLVTVAIWALLFLLGMSVGGNRAILDNLHTLGLEALALTAGGVLGSVALAWVVYRVFFVKRSGDEG